jgi:hypothetical protein
MKQCVKKSGMFWTLITKKLANYREGTDTCFWDLLCEEKKELQVISSIQQKNYKLIETFQGENIIRDMNAKGDAIYI